MGLVKLTSLLLAGIAATTSPLLVQAQTPPTQAAERLWMNASLSPEQRADTLIEAMTLEEKAGQVSQQFMFGAFEEFAPTVRDGKVGSLLFVTDPAIINRLQKVAVEETRLKIPLIFGYDVIHGFRTIFPVPLANAASWDLANVERAQEVAAAEARAVGIHWAFAPMLDIARDPRWGRIVESPGEDPFLGAAMARAQVRGFQGPEIGTPGRIISGPKHFIGYAAADGGRDYDSVFIADAELYNVYLPPFAAAVEAGAGNVMSAYMDVNDIPAVGNEWLLTDVLRGQLQFDGWVVSDANGVKNQVVQHFARDNADAAIRAISAGNDMEMSLGAAASAETLAASFGLAGSRKRWWTRPFGAFCRPSSRWACSRIHSLMRCRRLRRSPIPRTVTSPKQRPSARWCCSRTKVVPFRSPRVHRTASR